MAQAIIFDCEFLTAPGAPQRFWCGPDDPDPVIAQIGAVKLSLEPGHRIIETLRLYVIPRDRHGKLCPLDPLFTRLTGITGQTLAAEGMRLGDALVQLDGFSQGATFWSWGKDEFNMIAISCYVAGITPVIPATRFRNACDLVRKAGMPLEDIHKTRSNTLAAYFDVPHPPVRDHDALDDAHGVAWTLRHLLLEDRLSPADFQ